MKILSPI